MVAIIVVCALLVLVILYQNPKGGGLSSTFGGGGSQMFGVQRTNDFLDNATWTLAIIIGALVIISTVLVPRNKVNSSPVESPIPAGTENLPAPAENSDVANPLGDAQNTETQNN